MKPRVFASVLLVSLAAAAFAAVASAQSLQRLHVKTFVLSSDVQHPQLEQPFHLTLHADITENVRLLENVQVPAFSGALELLGDERRYAHPGGRGTTYDEIMTVVAHQRGTVTVSPAYLEAVDARDGKPKRFISNGLRLQVAGGALLEPQLIFLTAFWALVRLVGTVVVLGAAIFVIVAVFRRRPTVPEPQVAALPVAEPPVHHDPDAEFREAIARLRERRDRRSVLDARLALWRRSGLSQGATLWDYCMREPDLHRRDIARVVEIAAFIDDDRFPEAVDRVVAMTEGEV